MQPRPRDHFRLAAAEKVAVGKYPGAPLHSSKLAARTRNLSSFSGSRLDSGKIMASTIAAEAYGQLPCSSHGRRETRGSRISDRSSSLSLDSRINRSISPSNHFFFSSLSFRHRLDLEPYVQYNVESFWMTSCPSREELPLHPVGVIAPLGTSKSERLAL
jgi:hypothetical protein